ncbi:MAG: hypothetical protein RR500_04060 [Bacilli bacterium]
MYIGIFLGLMIGILIGGVVIICESNYCIIIGIFIIVLGIIIGAVIGIKVEKVNYEKFINSYNLTKETIEKSIKSSDITGLERVNLIEQINKKNEELEDIRVNVKQWWYSYLDKDLLNSLEPIKIE